MTAAADSRAMGRLWYEVHHGTICGRSALIRDTIDPSSFAVLRQGALRRGNSCLVVGIARCDGAVRVQKEATRCREKGRFSRGNRVSAACSAKARASADASPRSTTVTASTACASTGRRWLRASKAAPPRASPMPGSTSTSKTLPRSIRNSPAAPFSTGPYRHHGAAGSRRDLSATDAQALGRPIRALRIETALKDLTGALDGTFRLSGEIGGKTLRGHAHLARTVPQTWSLDRLAFNLGSVTLDGRVVVEADTLLAEGGLNLSAGNLDDLSALALTPMAGSLDTAVTLTREGGRQDAMVRAKGAGLRSGQVALAQLDAELRGQDLRRRPVIDGRLNADGLIAAGESIDTVRLTAQGRLTGSDLVLTATARGFELDVAARLVPAERTRIELSRFTAARVPTGWHSPVPPRSPSTTALPRSTVL